MQSKTRAIIVEQLRDLAEAFRRQDAPTAKAIRLIAKEAEAEDLETARKHWKALSIHVYAAVMDLAPVAYDWLRFGVAWPESKPRFTEDEQRQARLFLKKHGGDRHTAYNAALQKLIRTEKQEYSTIAAWCREKVK